ncbi:hypothetical protein DYB37_012658, partial [Aphanomyces astaci]
PKKPVFKLNVFDKGMSVFYDWITFPPGNRFIVTGGMGGDVRVWDIRKRDMVSHLKEHSMAITGLALFEDDVHLVSCSRDKSFLCWELRTERRIASHIQRMGGV